MIVKACVRSGMCCKKAPCGFGKWNSNKTKCAYLTVIDEQYACAIHDDIIKDPTAVISPAFGSGCCMSLFNESRNLIINTKYKGVEQFIEIKNYE